MRGAERQIVLPERLDPASLARLRKDVETASNGPVVVRGASERVFCEGLALGAHLGADVEARMEGLDDFRAIVRGLARADAPHVAVVGGRALGGGLGIAAACDIVIAGEDARFGLPEPLFGLIPGLITPIIRQRTTAAVLRRLVLAGESVDAETARTAGLVDIVVEQGGLEATADSWARRFSRAYRPAAGRLKRWLWDMSLLDEQLAQGHAHMVELLADEEVARRVARFDAGLVPWEDD